MPLNRPPYIPKEITVHLGAPSENAENVSLSFLDYVKNVASSEIYPTWEPAAIRANILAIVSYALNRVYTEYYRSRGYDFDITSSTAYDQKFIKNRTIFDSIANAAEETYRSYIRHKGYVEPLAAKFCNGTTSTCDGLSQWGSQHLAQEGYNSIDIIRNYYGDDIEIVVNAPIQEMTPSYPGTPLRMGVVGEPVALLQTYLNRISQNYPAIPKIWPVNGIFDEETEAAVKKFQQVFNLTQDGIVGSATWYEIMRLYVGIMRLAELVSEGMTLSDLSFQYPGILQQGDSGEEVLLLQYMLAVLGEFNTELPVISLDQEFGPETTDAVKKYQKYAKLPVDGIVGRRTWEQLYSDFSTIDFALRSDRVRFPLQATAETSSVLNRFSKTTRFGQYPGRELGLGSSDRSEVKLV